jgi:hypothetical protein
MPGMIDAYLEGEDWDEAPQAMDLEESYGGILAGLSEAVLRLREGAAGAEAEELALRVLFRAPALVNVILNYKICAEHGLPLHPTVYFELAEARRYRLPYPIEELERANRLYRSSIELARAACRLDAGLSASLAAFRAELPPEILSFVYTSARDKYTWRATEPSILRRLAAAVSREGKPGLIVAAAHGSIMPALIFAELLGSPLYFVRFSMFKRRDEEPILSIADEAWLAQWSGDYALIFDEDVAKGETLGRFSARLGPLFASNKTAASIRHAGASMRPDFVGKTWYD